MIEQLVSPLIATPFPTTFLDYPDDESCAVIVYMMGCSHNCIGCQNKDYQNSEFTQGTKQFSAKILIEEIKRVCKRNYTNKIVFSGGDPLFQNNIEFTRWLLSQLKNEFEVCIYTGYDISYVKQQQITGWKFIVVGQYKKDLSIQSEKTDKYLQLASTNQEIYDQDFICLTTEGRIYF